MERTAWARDRNFGIGEHQGIQLISLAAGELKIRRLMVALDRALDRCEEIMRRTGHPILCWLNSGSRNRFGQRPFAFLGKAATRQRYRRLFQRFLPFIFRAYNMAPAVGVSALGIRFTEKELIDLKRVWNDEAGEEGQGDLEDEEEKDRFHYESDLGRESGCEEAESEQEDDDEQDDEEEEEEENQDDVDEKEEKEDIERDETKHDSEIGEDGVS